MIALIIVVCVAGSIFYAVWKKKNDAKEAAAKAESAEPDTDN
jgi:uncharacterized protein YpmB